VWRVVLAVAGVALVAAGCGTTTRTVTVTVTKHLAPPREVTEFGFVKSLTQKGTRYELEFDPAWLVSGITASRAAGTNGPVANDFYLVDEGHRVLTYLVPPNARVRVLRRSPTATRISVAQLAALVAGRKPFPLYEPLTTGFWMVVDGDTVRSLEQQYKP
jgi:hypothetical protein